MSRESEAWSGTPRGTSRWTVALSLPAHHVAQPVTQEDSHPCAPRAEGPHGAAACWPQAFPVHALLTPRHGGQHLQLASQSARRGTRSLGRRPARPLTLGSRPPPVSEQRVALCCPREEQEDPRTESDREAVLRPEEAVTLLLGPPPHPVRVKVPVKGVATRSALGS